MARPKKSPIPIEEEAKKFIEKKLAKPPVAAEEKYKEALVIISAGLIARGTSMYRLSDLKREAEIIVDYLLSDN